MLMAASIFTMQIQMKVFISFSYFFKFKNIFKFKKKVKKNFPLDAMRENADVLSLQFAALL